MTKQVIVVKERFASKRAIASYQRLGAMQEEMIEELKTQNAELRRRLELRDEEISRLKESLIGSRTSAD